MKSSRASIERSNELLSEVLEKIPGVTMRNRSITTSSIYCRTPDGYGLRIGDHKGREKYSYKYNLDPTCGRSRWIREHNDIDNRDYWRYYTSSVDDLKRTIDKGVLWKEMG